MKGEWLQVPFRRLVTHYIGGGWGKEELDERYTEAAFVIRGTDIPAVQFGDVSGVPHRYHKASNLRSRRLLHDDIVFEVSGGSKDQPVGRALLVRDEVLSFLGSPAMCASFCKLVRIDTEFAHPRFIHYYLTMVYNDRRIMEYQTQSTGISNFRFEEFLDRHQVRLPPLAVQERVAAALAAYDELIANNLRRIELLEKMAQAVYREWFVNFRFPGHEQAAFTDTELGTVPSEWQVTVIGSITEVNRATLRANELPDELLYIDISSVSPGSIDGVVRLEAADAPSRARRVVRTGDTIWSTVRPNRRSYALVLDPVENTIASTGFAVLSPVAVPWSFLHLATSLPDFAAYLSNHATGAAYPAVKPSDFQAAPIVVPPRPLLDRFAELVDPMLVLRENLRRQNRNLQQTRDLLLPRLVSGEIDVSDLDIDTEWLAS